MKNLSGETRRLRLIELRDTRCNGSIADLSRKIQVDQSYVARMLYQEEKPGRKPIGEKMAKTIEDAFSLPRGWLDGHDLSGFEPGPEVRGIVPLISWVQAGEFCDAADPLAPGDAEQWLPCPREHGSMTYALRVRGESMAPRFLPGEIIMVDPDASPDSGKFVIARKNNTHEVTFKQLIREGSDCYLKPLNPQWPEPIIRMTEEWSICGVAICKIDLL